MNEQKTEGQTTSADIKKQIEAAKKELKESGLPLTGQRANEINASESTPKELPQVEVKPNPETPAAKSLEEANPQNSVDLKEWAKKKGIDWTSDDSVLKALHMSDQQFHEKRQKERSVERPNVPAYQPPVQYAPPAYVPPAPSQQQVINNLARQYNRTPEDIEFLMSFNRDFYQVASQTDRLEMERVKRETQKNSVFRELSSDPALKNPIVAAEFQRLLAESQNSDPESFEQNPTAYMKVRDAAIINYGRRNLEGQPLQEGVPPQARVVTPPTTPPRSYGNGSGGGAQENENTLTAEGFAKMTIAQKREVLEKAGLRPAF